MSICQQTCMDYNDLKILQLKIGYKLKCLQFSIFCLVYFRNFPAPAYLNQMNGLIGLDDMLNISGFLKEGNI